MTPKTTEREIDSEPHVHVVGTGGTVANVTGEYETPEAFLHADELIEKVPDVEELAAVTTSDVTRIGSSSLTHETWYDLHEEITRQAAGEDPPDGFVVPHGSNTAEETAYFLNLTLGIDRPVVLTAAMRGLSDVGSEAMKNMRDAIRVAARPEAAGRGTLFVVNGEIHHARDFTKTAHWRMNAWESPNFGPVGYAHRDKPVEFYRSVDRKTAPDTVFDVEGVPRDSFPLRDVHVVFSAMETGPALVEAAVSEGAEGIVVAGLPTGHGAKPRGMPGQSEALHRAAEQEIPVVMCTRGYRGRIAPDRMDAYPNPYGIAGDTLRPQKARVLLALGLTETDDPATLQEYFTTY